MMYAIKLPPELVSRLYRLREEHRLGPIRRQVLTAVEHYVEDMEREYGTGNDATSGTTEVAPGSPSPTRTPRRARQS